MEIRLKSLTHKIGLLVVLCFAIFPVRAQVDSIYTKKYLEKSTTFASTTFGADVLVLTGGKTEFLQNNTIKNTEFGSTTIPRLTIGGIHFWGHAGISFRLLTFSHQSSGNSYGHGSPRYQKMIKPLQFGLTYATSKYYLSVSTYVQARNKFTYYLSPTLQSKTQVDPISWSFSFIRSIDTDKSMREPRGIKQENLKFDLLKKRNKLSAWYWGLGASASLQMSRSPYLKKNFAFLYDDFLGGFTPDVSFGRHFHRLDLNAGISFRSIQTNLKAFDTRIKLKRYSAMAEVYKNLFNYLGFVPFAGITGSIEHLQMNVDEVEVKKTKPAIGLVAGWDIRVTKTGTSVLRTNLRWIPNLHLNIDGEKMMFDHLEFNFIQWAQYIGRKKVYRSA
jgi:hypothetical protein